MNNQPADTAQVRALLETVRRIAPCLTKQEVSDLATTLMRAMDRIDKEVKGARQ